MILGNSQPTLLSAIPTLTLNASDGWLDSTISSE